jgi:hypothetical protein
MSELAFHELANIFPMMTGEVAIPLSIYIASAISGRDLADVFDRHNTHISTFWYLATPYSKYPDGLEAAFQEACRVTAWFIRRKIPCYCPIAETHALAHNSDLDPADHDIWLPFDLPKMEAAGGLIVCMLPTWENSFGIHYEYNVFTKARKPIWFLEWPEGVLRLTPQEVTMGKSKKKKPSRPFGSATVREFSTGATRDSGDGKFDYEGFLSPLVLECYARYMHRHRQQSDGQMRESDNWQKGIPQTAYIKSLFRHFVDLWLMHRGHACYDKRSGQPIILAEALCGVIFNAMGYLHELLKPEEATGE